MKKIGFWIAKMGHNAQYEKISKYIKGNLKPNFKIFIADEKAKRVYD